MMHPAKKKHKRPIASESAGKRKHPLKTGTGFSIFKRKTYICKPEKKQPLGVILFRPSTKINITNSLQQGYNSNK